MSDPVQPFVYEKLKPEVKPLILAALRDPDAEQTKGHLMDKSGMCCLGVITECAIKAGVQLRREWNDEEGEYTYLYNLPGRDYESMDSAVLPTPVREWAGLRTSDPFIGAEGDYHFSATTANDLRGLTLPQIADLIEENL